MESDKEQREEFEAWERTQPRCIGYPKCDGGDLVGVEHEKDCPLYGVARSTGRRWMFGHLEVWQAAQSPLLERIRELESRLELSQACTADFGELSVKAMIENDKLRSRVAELEQRNEKLSTITGGICGACESNLNAPIPPSTKPK